MKTGRKRKYKRMLMAAFKIPKDKGANFNCDSTYKEDHVAKK